jgi:hypothetical protein
VHEFVIELCHTHAGTSLLEQSRTMKQDIGGLFGKIDRKAALEAHNAAAASGYVNDLYSQARLFGCMYVCMYTHAHTLCAITFSPDTHMTCLTWISP